MKEFINCKPFRRYPKHVFQGQYVNVIEQPTGERTLSLRKGGLEGQSGFTEYCLGVINEISHVVKMLSL